MNTTTYSSVSLVKKNTLCCGGLTKFIYIIISNVQNVVKRLLQIIFGSFRQRHEMSTGLSSYSCDDVHGSLTETDDSNLPLFTLIREYYYYYYYKSTSRTSRINYAHERRVQ